jgi:SAM-dependent methyltransferase
MKFLHRLAARLRLSSLDPLELGVSALGRERFMTVYYAMVYWWIGRLGLTGFNYGYAPLSEAVRGDTAIKEPYQIELYRQIADTLGVEHLRDRCVLEISSGLGGGLAYLMKSHAIRFGIATDRSRSAVRWARRRFGHHAVMADACMLPFATGSCDVILNVEASHIYFSDAFLSEVARVLKPGGLLAMSDERDQPAAAVQESMAREFDRHGLELIRFRDVTGNIADACALDAPRRVAVLNTLPWPSRQIFRLWVGVEDSPRFTDFHTRTATYFILVARRKGGA